MYAFFIRRPVVAVCIALIILLGGAFAAWRLPVAQYPDIVPPEIQITASYPGADCRTVVDAVASPMEQQMSGVAGMDYMTSTSTNDGAMTLSVLFEVGSEPDMDQVLSYLRYAESASQLPAEVGDMGVSLRKVSGPPMLLYTVTSPDGGFSGGWLANYAYINLVNPLMRVPGVGNVEVLGAGRYAMRIWLRPERMAALRITVPEVIAAVKAQNAVHPVGKVGAEPAVPGQLTSYTVRAEGRLSDAEEFGRIILRADDGSIVRLSDVARVELGAESYSASSRYNGRECAVLAVYQAPGSNALDTVAAVEKALEQFALPPGVNLTLALDTTESVRLGIREIVTTLAAALVLVMLVVFVFLQGWRAALIPLAAVPVSIVGVFVVLAALGMEINTVCLMGLVLAVGLVVDDAIVVVEAAQNHIDAGERPQEAVLKAMKEVAGPVAATALVLASVFSPSMLLPGISGELFKQFAVTIGASILLSAFNALSLSPALAALLLRPAGGKAKGVLGRAGERFNAVFGRLRRGYGDASASMIRRPGPAGMALLLVALLLVPLGRALPGGFLPDEDEGYFYGTLQLPWGTALGVTEQASAQVEKILIDNPLVRGVVTVSGFNMMTGVESPNNSFFFVDLVPWDERGRPGGSAAALSLWLRRQMNEHVPEAVGFSMTPPPIPGVGASSDITLMVEDRANRGEEYLSRQTAAFIDAVKQRPEILAVDNFMAADTPQIFLRLDEEKAAVQGVDIAEAYQTLQAFLGSVFVNYFNRFGYQWQVYLQADAPARMDLAGLRSLYLDGKDGVQVPLDSLVSVKRITGPDFLIRQNMYNASMLDIVPAEGFTASQAMAAIEEVFQVSMPSDMGYSYTGMSYQQRKQAGGMGAGTLFAFSSIFIYLILASLYESWRLPLAVLLPVPVAVAGALGALLAAGLSLDLYAEIGLIMLIALAAKNAILVVQFGVDRIAGGDGVLEAALAAARVRLRPILMTSLAFVLGCVPLALASGAGAAARHVVGVAVIGGMGAASAVGIFFLPFAFYVVVRRWRKGGRSSSVSGADG